MTYTDQEINAAIDRTETAKQNNPVGFVFLGELGFDAEAVVAYAFATADAHLERLAQERDRRVIYTAGWLNGLAVGSALEPNSPG